MSNRAARGGPAMPTTRSRTRNGRRDRLTTATSVIRRSIDRRNSGAGPNGGWHALLRAVARRSRETGNRHGKPTCERLAAQTRCPCGRVRPGSDGLWISRTISSRSNFAASRFNRVALRSHLCVDQKSHGYQTLVIIDRLDPCPWGAGVSTNPAVAVAPGADHLDRPAGSRVERRHYFFSGWRASRTPATTRA